MTITALTFVLIAAAVLFLLKCLQAFSAEMRPRRRARLLKALRNAQLQQGGAPIVSPSHMAD
jgi:hypothetical protein